VAVAALTAWHVAHERVRRSAAGTSIPAHARLETYSVLTRLPPAHRVHPSLAAELLDSWYPAEATLVPSTQLSRDVVARCARLGVAGGAVYDALVALTALEADAVLLTRDHRAASTYQRIGVRFRLLR
jgi:hypothetical protein